LKRQEMERKEKREKASIESASDEMSEISDNTFRTSLREAQMKKLLNFESSTHKNKLNLMP
jgi:hypothetical protein